MYNGLDPFERSPRTGSVVQSTLQSRRVRPRSWVALMVLLPTRGHLLGRWSLSASAGSARWCSASSGLWLDPKAAFERETHRGRRCIGRARAGTAPLSVVDLRADRAAEPQSAPTAAENARGVISMSRRPPIGTHTGSWPFSPQPPAMDVLRWEQRCRGAFVGMWGLKKTRLCAVLSEGLPVTHFVAGGMNATPTSRNTPPSRRKHRSFP